MTAHYRSGRRRHCIENSCTKRKIEFNRVCTFIQSSYWGEGRSAEDIKEAFGNSVCFSGFSDCEQVAFARVRTDTRYFAYFCDVFDFDEHRGRGFSKRLVKTILDHESLSYVRWAMLATRDAHGLYAQFGFEPVAGVARLMERRSAC